MLELTEPKTVWRAYNRMSKLLRRLPSHTASVIRKVLDIGVTPTVMEMAKQAPEKEWSRYQILRMIGNGNPDRLSSLTDLAMDEIRLALEEGELSAL